jgi:hypothetical protein
MNAANVSIGSLKASESHSQPQAEPPQHYDLDLRYLEPLATSMGSQQQSGDGNRSLPGVAHDDTCVDDCTAVGVYYGLNFNVHHQRTTASASFHSRNRHSVAHLGYPYLPNTDDHVITGFASGTTQPTASGLHNLMQLSSTGIVNYSSRGYPAPTWPNAPFSQPPGSRADEDCRSLPHDSGCCDSRCEPGEPCTGSSCAAEESACFDAECAVTPAAGRNAEIVNAAAALASFGSQDAQPDSASWLPENNMDRLPMPSDGLLGNGLDFKFELTQSTIDEISRHLLYQHADTDASSCIRPCIIDNSNFFGSCHLLQPGYENMQTHDFSRAAPSAPDQSQAQNNAIHQHSLDCGASIRNGDDLIQHFNRDHRPNVFPTSTVVRQSRMDFLHSASSAGSFFDSNASSARQTPDAGFGDGSMSAGSSSTNTPSSTIDDNDAKRYFPATVQPDTQSPTNVNREDCCCQWRAHPGLSICGERYANSEALFTHIIQAHIKTLPKTDSGFRCGWKDCPREQSDGSVFPQRSKIERHMQTHASRKSDRIAFLVHMVTNQMRTQTSRTSVISAANPFPRSKLLNSTF